MSSLKLDANFGTGDDYLKQASATAHAAEEIGFSGLWSSETQHDGFLPLVLAADATRDLSLGTSIAVAFSRSPMELAQTAWDLQSLSDGRFVLGLGTQVKAHVTRRFSMPFDRPAARLKDYILALRKVWHSFQTGEPLKYEGEFYQHTLLSPFFDPGPIEHPGIPVHIAGVNERLATLAGEVCDGFHVHPFHSPEYVRQSVLPAIERGAEKTGRSMEDVDLVTSVFVVTGGSEHETEEQREAIRSQAAFYASTPSYRIVLEAHGWEEVGDRLSNLARDKKWDEMPVLITDEMLAAFSIEVPPDELGAALKDRYEGLVDRVSLYLPFVPGERDEFWRTTMEGMR